MARRVRITKAQRRAAAAVLSQAARAATTPEQRSASASNAAKARWAKWRAEKKLERTRKELCQEIRLYRELVEEVRAEHKVTPKVEDPSDSNSS